MTLISHQLSTAVNRTPSQTKNNTSESLKNLAIEICGNLESSKRSGDGIIGQRIEDTIREHLHISQNSKDYKQKISNFLNKNSSSLICNFKSSNSRQYQHFLKRAIHMKMHEILFYDFLFTFDEPPLQFNAIEIHNGTKETVLDYIDNFLKKSDLTKTTRHQIEVLRDILIDSFGAKKAVDIT